MWAIIMLTIDDDEDEMKKFTKLLQLGRNLSEIAFEILKLLQLHEIFTII